MGAWARGRVGAWARGRVGAWAGALAAPLAQAKLGELGVDCERALCEIIEVKPEYAIPEQTCAVESLHISDVLSMVRAMLLPVIFENR